MITTHLPIFNLKRGIRVNEYVTIEELDHFLGAGTALKFANEWVNKLLSERARTVVCYAIEATGFVRKEGEEPHAFVKRWLVYINSFSGPSQVDVLDLLQNLVDKIEPLTYTAKRAEPVKPNKEILGRARIIFNNQTEGKWKKLLQEEGIELLAWTGNHDNDIAILADGLKRYNDKEMEREFV